MDPLVGHVKLARGGGTLGLLGKMSAFALQLQAELHFSSKGRSLGLRHSKAWEVKGSAVFCAR